MYFCYNEAMIIGVTGPIGSGKDEVCRILAHYGAKIIDADKIGHRILGKGIDRKKLGDEVFSDKKKLKALNRAIHPKIKNRIVGQVATCPYKNIAINAALLKEIGLIELCDEVWVVMASKAQRMRRLAGRPYDKKKINNIMKNQMPQKGYLKIADRVIWNRGSKMDLKNKIENLMKGQV